MSTVVPLWGWLRERWLYTSTVNAYDERKRLQAANEGQEQQKSMSTNGVTVSGEDLELGGVVTPIRRLQPGEILDVVIKLRKMLSEVETAAFTLYASFEDIGGRELEAKAEKARHTIELAVARANALCADVERTTVFQELRQATLDRRKGRLDRRME